METTVTSPSAEYPSLSDRIQSTFIDMVFIIIMMFVFSSVLERYDKVPDWVRMLIFLGLWGVYEPLCTCLGATIGNSAKQIRVRSMEDTSRRINILQAFFRYGLKITLGWISFLTIHFNPERRAIHDLAVGSVMIKK